jgi:hypothetical protein
MIQKAMIMGLIYTALASGLLGHGINVTVAEKYPFIVVHASYPGGKVLADSHVTVVFGVGGEKFQEGNTDQNGNFCFYPDKPGTWEVTLDDLRGHRKKKEVILNQDFFKPLPPAAPVSPSGDLPAADSPASITRSEWCCYMLKIVLGVVLILGITFVLHRLTKRRETVDKK